MAPRSCHPPNVAIERGLIKKRNAVSLLYEKRVPFYFPGFMKGLHILSKIVYARIRVLTFREEPPLVKFFRWGCPRGVRANKFRESKLLLYLNILNLSSCK